MRMSVLQWNLGVTQRLTLFMMEMEEGGLVGLRG